MELFGFQIKRKDKELPSFSPKEENDGAVVVSAGGSSATYIDLDGIVKTESELVTKYRNTATAPEIDTAIDEIVNEIVDIEQKNVVEIDIDDKTVTSDKVRKAITDEFKECKRLLDFNNSCYEIVRRWYVDGRLKYHVILDKANPAAGIQELRYIDPRKLRKVREVVKDNPQKSDQMNKTVSEYYLYSEKGFINKLPYSTNQSVTSLKIAKDSIIDVPSGLTDVNNTTVISYLDKAIKPLNQLRTLEDASVIYTLARAPERRVWYIDVGNLPKAKAEQQMQEIMKLHKNRLVYDQNTGQISDQRKFISMLEDYWLPRRGESGKGTEVSTLPGGQNMGEMTQIEYFKKKLYNSLNIPVQRFSEDNVYSIGRGMQITRDEVKFSKFIVRLRLKIAQIFNQFLERQLVLKKIITPEDWLILKDTISYTWASNNYFDELKEAEILNDRINNLNNIQPLIGQFYSRKWVQKNILKQSEEMIEEMQQEMKEEQEEEIQNNMNEPENQDSNSENQDSNSEDDTDSTDDRVARLHQAKVTFDKLKDKEDKNPTELHSFMSAAQTLAKNKADKPSRKIA